VLPLTSNTNLSPDLGTRHRAGIGMSEHSDAVIVIVSEETGGISIAVDGMLKRRLSPDTFEAILRSELVPAEEQQRRRWDIIVDFVKKLNPLRREKQHEQKRRRYNKIVSSKAFWIIISLLASFLLWTYIMSTEETTIEMTFSNVKVVYQGADDLRATRGLIVTGADADTVSVRLKGTRRVLGNLSSADLSAVIDVSGISQAREMQVSYSLQYPTNVDKSSITVLSKSPETI
ncbi:protein containing DNA integrity scanning protein, DisA, partial [human gut metagenome]